MKTDIYYAAGNRRNTGITVDNLNRATASQDGARSSDILGNTTMITYSGGAQSQYDWDCLNRLPDKKNGSTVQASYTYRTDGMRTGKYVASGKKTAAYRYDGQMGIQDVETSPGTTTVTDYAIGARGIDGISTNTNGTGATVSYPIYDAHGNNVLTLTKSGTNFYSTGNQRSYDAWGAIRIGSPNGDPHGQYCANLGHKADDETGFIYMRARYYEPSTARWLSEDVTKYGRNWFTYCLNNPTNCIDKDGNTPLDPATYVEWYAMFVNVAITTQAANLIARSFCVMWTAFLTAETAAALESPGVVDFELFQKWMFVKEVDKAVFMTKVIGSESVAAQAIAATEAYTFGLQISTWIILGDVLL